MRIVVLACLVVLAAAKKPGSCPPPPKGAIPCYAVCSSDEQCPGNELCCHYTCQYSCHAPVNSTSVVGVTSSSSTEPAPVVHQGECPVTEPSEVSSCIVACMSDGDCATDQKCCTVGCGRTCYTAVAPSSTASTQAPGSTAPVSTAPAVGSCTANSDCGQGEYCFKGDSAAVCDLNSVGVCTSRNQMCPNSYSPVCGCDGVTYSNACNARLAGVNVAAAAPCRTTTDSPLASTATAVVEASSSGVSSSSAPLCGKVMCMIYCEYGFETDANGCEICSCNAPPPSQATTAEEPASTAVEPATTADESTTTFQCPLAMCLIHCPLGAVHTEQGCFQCKCQEAPAGCKKYNTGCGWCDLNPDGSIESCAQAKCAKYSPGKCELFYEGPAPSSDTSSSNSSSSHGMSTATMVAASVVAVAAVCVALFGLVTWLRQRQAHYRKVVSAAPAFAAPVYDIPSPASFANPAFKLDHEFTEDEA